MGINEHTKDSVHGLDFSPGSWHKKNNTRKSSPLWYLLIGLGYCSQKQTDNRTSIIEEFNSRVEFNNVISDGVH